MMSHSLLPSFLLLLFITRSYAQDFRWIDDKSNPGYNCAGKVSDAVCCKDNFCSTANNEADCKAGPKQLLCAWNNGRCTSFRDSQNNVCCQSEVKDACDKVARGICPADWQVPEDCCSPMASKWNGTLVGVKPGFVCCNAPCTEMQKAGCQLPAKCAPAQRSIFGMASPINLMGFNTALVQAQNAALGKVFDGSGFQGSYGLAVASGLGDGKSRDQQVDEITVDDLMATLIEALSADKDAMIYNAEINSDPYLGKIKSGGPLAGMNLPNPNYFLNTLYGNPFGFSGANILGGFPQLPLYYPQNMLGLPTPMNFYGSQSPYPPMYGYQSPFQYNPYQPAPRYQPPAQYTPPIPQYQPPQYQPPQYRPPQPPQYRPPQPPQYRPPQPPQYQPPQPPQYQPPQPPQYQPPQPPQYQPPPAQQSQAPPQQSTGPIFPTKS